MSYKDRKEEDTTHRGAGHVKTEAETGVVELHATECQELSSSTEAGKRERAFLPQRLRRK